MKLVVFDLDSTLIAGESLDAFGKLAGKEEVLEITAKAMAGEMSFEEALKKRVKLLKGLEIKKIEATAKEIPLMKGAAETISELKNSGIKTAVVSGGFSIVAERVKKELGIDYSIANEFVVKNGKITGAVKGPLTEEGSKGKALAEMAEEAGVGLEECVAVGDGANDIPMLERAGLSIAFNSKPVLKKVADVIVKKNDLREILPHVLQHNTKDMLRERGEVEAEIERLRREITAKKDSLKSSPQRRRELINEIMLQNADANKFKKQRDDLNDKVRNHKRERDEANARIKDLIPEYKTLQEKVPKKDFKNLQRLKKSLEWKLQTRVMEIKKEDELVGQIEKLNSELEDYTELIELSDRLDEDRRKSKNAHEAIMDFSSDSQRHHEKFLEAIKDIKETEKKIDQLNEERDNIHKEIEGLKKSLEAALRRNKTLKEDLQRMKPKATQRRDGDLKEQAQDIYERFRKGEKLTLGDIYLLRRFDLV